MVDILLPVKPYWSTLIFRQLKTVQLLRQPPTRHPTGLIVYETAPTMRIVGRANIRAIQNGSPALIWEQFGHESCLPKPYFDWFTQGRNTISALTLTHARPYDLPWELHELGIHTPHGVTYLNVPSHANSILTPELTEKTVS